MFQKRNNRQTFLLLFITIKYATPLPTPQNISIHSVNLRHILTWSPLQADCATVNYSVKFQGEYERYMLNGSWVDAYDCQKISKTECDMTFDLASDSDYSIGVQAHCNGQTSWAQLLKTFNRRDTLLVAPNMSVTVTENLIQVGFSELLPDTIIYLRMWTEGNEQSVLHHVIKAQPYHFSFNTKQDGEKHCLKAEASVESLNKSITTEKHCVVVPRPQLCWLKPVTVSVAVVITVAMALTLGWSAPRYGPWFRQAICHHEPLPNVLLKGWPDSTSRLSSEVPLELTHSVLLLPPSEVQEREPTTNATCAENVLSIT